MSVQDYTKAQKSAEKQFKQDGKYLPVLEEILRGKEIEGQLPLGQIEIPISMIVGTAQSERTSAFASNFMPLLNYETEFGTKWSELCDSVREVGVHEPITVMEYMQRFYVCEGNKRVSVSIFNGAVSIEAKVTRIIPKPDKSKEYRIYTEFMDFYRISGIYEIEMNQPGEFLRLIQTITPMEVPDGPDQNYKLPPPWNEELRKDVRFLYSIFSGYYLDKYDQRMPLKPGVAFLHFLEIFGFEQIRGLSSLELRRRINQIRKEFNVIGNVNPSSYILDPTEVSRKVALTKKIPLTGTQVLHIAFLFPRDPRGSGWSYNHELGRRYLEDTFGEAITTVSYTCDVDEAETIIEQAIAEGCRMIFTTSPVYHAVSMRMAVAHPEVIILNCSMNTAYKQLRTYYLRIYEAKFINGLIAGYMTESERIGYIADYPVLGMPASVSAFALGVKMVNPRAMVYLDWSTLENHDPHEYFRSKQIDVISSRDIKAPELDDTDFGLYALYGDVSFRLAMPVWNWGNLYEELVHSVLIGAWKNDGNQNESQALNYYWGMSSGAIDVFISDKLPAGIQRLVNLVKKAITENEFKPFTGPIYGQDGTCKVEAEQFLLPDEIIKADWMPDNVFGKIPKVSELDPKFRDFAKWHTIFGIEEEAGPAVMQSIASPEAADAIATTMQEITANNTEMQEITTDTEQYN